MTRHHTPSPEDRFNAYLDALASGRSTPDASDFSAGTNAESATPDDAVHELHDLARAAESRQGGPPEQLWETIMYEGAASPGSASAIPRREEAAPRRLRSRTLPESNQPTRSRLRQLPSSRKRSVLTWVRRITPAASAAVLLMIVVGIVALGTPWSRIWPEETPPVRLPALSGSLPTTPSGTSVPEVNSCLANSGLVYRTNELSDSGDVTLKRATSVDGEDAVVSTWAATTAFDSGMPDIAIGIGNGTFTAKHLSTGETTILGYASQPSSSQPRVEQIQFGPWIVAPENPYRTDWTVTYLPTMEQTQVSSTFTNDELQPYSVTPKVSADGSTLALVVIPDNPNQGTGNARRVQPSVLVMTEQSPSGLLWQPLANGDPAMMGNLVSLSPDGSKFSAPAVRQGGADQGTMYLLIWDISGQSLDSMVITAEQQLEDDVSEGLAFFSPSGDSLVTLIDGAIRMLPAEGPAEASATGTYKGRLYGAVIAPGGEGALIGLRQTAAESPSAWVWMDGTTGEIRQLEDMDHFVLAHVHVDPDHPPVVMYDVVELTRSDRESGPSMVFFDPASGTVINELRDIAGGRIAGIGGYWTIPSTDGSLILTRLDDEAFIKANRPATGEQWAIPVPDNIPTTKLAAFPSPDGACIALADADAALSETAQPIWVVAAQPGAEPVLVAEGWFANWYQAPVTTGP